jgi:hypothetical protein
MGGSFPLPYLAHTRLPCLAHNPLPCLPRGPFLPHHDPYRHLCRRAGRMPAPRHRAV